MRKWLSLICIVCLALLATALPRLRGQLPTETRPLIEKKYGGWSGVLRLWVHEGWPAGSGSIAGWLNGCIAGFEKAHPGVYIQPEYVDAGTMAGLGDDGLLPPDLALFPPGLITTPRRLAPLSAVLPLRDSLADSGRVGDALLAAPVLAGGYLWAYNAALTEAIPPTWRDTGLSIAAQADEPFRRWGAALLALCSARYDEIGETDGPGPDSDAMDLGLSPGDATPTPAPTAAPDAPALDCMLPEDFAFSENAWRGFVNGEFAAIPVTQREIRRLEALSEQGRGVDWRLARTGEGVFTDQLLFAAIVLPEEPSDAGAASRRALGEAFIAQLLSDGCQGTLCRAGAFSVTDAASGYAFGDALAEMDQALRAPGLAVPNAFDIRWREDADEIVRKFIDNSGAASALWRQFAGRLAEKHEHLSGQRQNSACISSYI